MSLVLQSGQTVKVDTGGRDNIINYYGNYRSAGYRGQNMSQTLQDCETGIHYNSPNAFVKAQFRKIDKEGERNAWDYIQCMAGTNNEWVFINSLRV